MAAQIRRRTRPIEHERIRRRRRERIIDVTGRVEAHIRERASFQLVEEWTEPVRMLVEDRDRRALIERERLARDVAHTCRLPEKNSDVPSPHQGAPELEANQVARCKPAPG